VNGLCFLFCVFFSSARRQTAGLILTSYMCFCESCIPLGVRPTMSQF